MLLTIRLIADMVHIAMMLYICVMIFDVSFNQERRKWMATSTFIIFFVMTFKSYLQLDYPLMGRSLEMFLLIIMALCVRRLVNRSLGESLALSFVVMIIAAPVYFIVTLFWMRSDGIHATFRYLEMITSIGLIVFYGLIMLALTSRFKGMIKNVLRKLIINFRVQLIATYIFMSLSVLGSDLIELHLDSTGHYMVMLGLSFGVMGLLVTFVLINRQRKVHDILDKKFKMLEFQSKTVDDMLSNLYHEEKDDAYLQAMQALKDLKHPVLQGLLMTHVQIAKKMKSKIDFHFETDFQHVHMDDLQMARAIGVLVDNALESESKLVKVFLTEKDGAKYFRVENTYKTLKIEKGQWLSTKGRNRGQGLKSLQALLDIHPNMSLETQVTETHVIKELKFKEV
ncbi:GHKL domain-containing protein [Acidaminobacter sp. JC074]|uniref:GHKL domain-containing protein n=1 Tax=Acidaminobacter sp. JC074 TaxID=2530199 RepID=UPI001F108471|nr:GHKL domain-containing protein [Acidaminobacter sp. JC074]